MKSRINPFVRLSSLLTACTIAFSASAQALDYTWGGTTGNWTDASWNPGPVAGPTTAGNTATINSGNVTVNVGGPGSLDSITLGSGSQLNLSNSAYGYFDNLVLQGGTVSGSGNYNAYGAAIFGDVTVSGTSASTIAGSSFFNLSSTSTFTVADATGDANTDLLVTTSLRGPTGSPDWTYNTAKLVKEGAGTMEVTVHSYFRGGLDLNAGTLKLSGGNGGYGFFDGTVTVNSGTTLETVSDGTGLGWQNGWKPAAVNINGGTITTAGVSHIWGISGGVNMTGGTLQSNNGVSDPNGGQLEWWQTAVTTNASADTATIGGRIRIRADGGYGGIPFNVADGAAATDLLVSAAINEANGTVGITKSGAGTMVLSGANSYSGATTVNGGTLVLSGSSSSSATINVNATGTLALSAPILDDAANIVIANGGAMALNFTGNDVVGSLDIDGSGPLPAGLYNSSHLTYGTYFTGGGSLEILAQDGTWTSLADGNWSGSSNWASGIIAVGTDNTATFNAGTGVTVTLDGNRIIGNLAFDISDYTIAGANTLTLDTDSTVPAISVTAGRTATVSANLGGSEGMEKTGAGTLVLSGVKSYTGGTTVTAGTLEISSATGDQSAVNGILTVKSGATLKLSGADYTGLGRLGSTVTALEVEGGTVDSSIESWVTGATVNLTGGTMSASGSGRYQIISSSFNSIASSTTSTISGNLLIRKDYGSSDLNIFVEDSPTVATDLLISGSIQQVGTAGVSKSGEGKLVLSGTNTYTGNTAVTDGALEVTSAGSLRFRPTDNTVTNQVSTSGTGTLSFLGTVDLDLSAANVTTGNTWTLFNLGSYTGLAPFAVNSTAGAFSKSGTTWTLTAGANTWTFQETTGVLSLAVVTATDYDTWKTANGVTGGENDDDDADGLTNREEYAFGTDPTGGSEVNPIVIQLNKTTGKFSYTRRATPLITGLSYKVWTSTDLVTWTEDTGATLSQTVTGTVGEVETVEATLTGTLPLTQPKLFIQVRAE